jgi:hypothetical protein
MNWDAYWGVAITEAERRLALEQRRVVAAALWVELTDLGAKLAAASQRVVPTTVQLETSVFDRSQTGLACLPPQSEATVRRAYKLVRELSSMRASPASIDGNHSDDMRQRIVAAVEDIRTALRGLGEIAGIADDQARAAMAALDPGRG